MNQRGKVKRACTQTSGMKAHPPSEGVLAGAHHRASDDTTEGTPSSQPPGKERPQNGLWKGVRSVEANHSRVRMIAVSSPPVTDMVAFIKPQRQNFKWWFV